MGDGGAFLKNKHVPNMFLDNIRQNNIILRMMRVAQLHLFFRSSSKKLSVTQMGFFVEISPFIFRWVQFLQLGTLVLRATHSHTKLLKAFAEIAASASATIFLASAILASSYKSFYSESSLICIAAISRCLFTVMYYCSCHPWTFSISSLSSLSMSS